MNNKNTLIKRLSSHFLGTYSTGEIYVENSVPVPPGTKIDIISEDSNCPAVVVRGVTVEYVRWKVPGPFRQPAYPASGFVGVSLAENQWEFMKKTSDLFVKPTEK
jgi:hypothetical protein